MLKPKQFCFGKITPSFVRNDVSARFPRSIKKCFEEVLSRYVVEYTIHQLGICFQDKKYDPYHTARITKKRHSYESE